VITAHEEGELVELVHDSRPAGRIAWALSRFEMGCERPLDTEALSDYLLALESLLEAGDEAGRASLTLRLAALCAEEHERKGVQRRVELAFALERRVMGGGGANAYLEALGPDTPQLVVMSVEQHVRALLRDVLCGYLTADLKGAADDILLASSEDLEIHAEDIREQPAARSPQPAEPRRQAVQAGFRPIRLREPKPLPEPEPQLKIEEPEPVTADMDSGVTPSADWEFDDDPSSYSAPI
jgi:hypothetical protein